MEVKDWVLDKFSFTKLKTFALCPRKAYLQYVAKRREPASLALIAGRASHEVFEYDNLSKIAGVSAPVPELHEVGVTALERDAAREDVALGPAKDGYAAELREQLIRFEESGQRAEIRPVPGSVEAAFQAEVKVGRGWNGEEQKPALLEGFVDVVSLAGGDPVAVDLKTAGKPVNDREAGGHLQLAAEAICSGTDAGRILSWVRWGKQKPNSKITGIVRFGEAMVERVWRFVGENILGFREAYKKDVWPKTNPEGFLCQVCAFRSTCWPQKDPEIGKLVVVEKISPAGSLPPQDWRMSDTAKKFGAK